MSTRKPASHGLMCQQKNTFDTTTRAMSWKMHGGDGTAFLLATIESAGEKAPLRDEFLDELALILEHFAQNPRSFPEVGEHFEAAMHGANDSLHEWLIKHRGAVDQSKSGVLTAVLSGTNLVLTGFGTLQSLFIHTTPHGDRQTYDLFKELGKETKNDNKLFKSVLQGELEPGDTVVFGSPALFRILSKEELSEIIQELPASGAAEQLKQRVARNEENIAAITIRMSTHNAKSALSASLSVERLKEAEYHTEHVLTGAPRQSGSWFRPFREYGIKGIKWLGENLKSIVILLVGSIFGLAKKIFLTLLQAIKNLQVRRLIIAIVIVCALVIAGVSIKNRYLEKQALENRLVRTTLVRGIISNLVSNAESRRIFDEPGASESLRQAISALHDYRQETKEPKALSDLDQEIARIDSLLRHETLKEARVRFSISGFPTPWTSRLWLVGNDFWVTHPSGAITKNGTLVAHTKQPIFTSLPETDGLYAISYSISNPLTWSKVTAKVIGQEIVSSLPGTTLALMNYGARFYSLDPTQRMILRNEKKNDPAGAWKPWLLKADPDLKNARTLAIDGDIFVATDSEVFRYQKGLRRSWKLGAVSPAITDIDRLWTSADTSKLYLFESNTNRVLIFEKTNGLFERQLLITSRPANIVDFAINEKQKKIFILGDAKVYEISL